jgi:hypothetical protein
VLCSVTAPGEAGLRASIGFVCGLVRSRTEQSKESFVVQGLLL